MAAVEIILFQKSGGRVPVLDSLRKKQFRQARAKIVAAIHELADQGHEAKQPLVRLLEDKIYELRAEVNRNAYRVLFFFHERKAVVLSHLIVKKTDRMPPTEIEQAKNHRDDFLSDPQIHSYRGGL